MIGSMADAIVKLAPKQSKLNCRVAHCSVTYGSPVADPYFRLHIDLELGC